MDQIDTCIENAERLVHYLKGLKAGGPVSAIDKDGTIVPNTQLQPQLAFVRMQSLASGLAGQISHLRI